MLFDSQLDLRSLYLVVDEDYINAQIGIEEACAISDAECLDLLDAESMFNLYERGFDIEIGQVY